MASAASSSSMRSLRSLAIAIPRNTHARTYASISPYTPSSTSDPSLSAPRRPSRPASAEFFTGRPTFHESLAALESTIKFTTSALRAAYVYPLPSALPHVPPPTAHWVSPEELSTLFDVKLRTNTLRQVMELLTELHHLRHVSDLSGHPELAQNIDIALEAYERGEHSSKGEIKGKKSEAKVDEFGRAYAAGRKKTSSARVWMIPTSTAASASASAFTPTPAAAATDAAESATTSIPTSQVLINHIPLATYFPRPSDREAVLRPLRISGLLGGFNIFALSRGGGIAGQAGAVGLGVARALAILREDARDVLQADGALMRDTRMTERKKTGRAKARKAYTWVKR